MDQSIGAQSAGMSTAASLNATKSMGGNETKQLETSVKESMTLIDRFYNGGNRARPAALDILVVVLDGVVRRMRQQYASRKKFIEDGNAEIATIDARIAAIQATQAPLKKELEERQARAAYLREAIEKGTGTITDSVSVARAALEKAQLISRKNEKVDIASLKLSIKGYDGKGHALPERSENLRKKIGGPAARKPGDLEPQKTLEADARMIERAHKMIAVPTPK